MQYIHEEENGGVFLIWEEGNETAHHCLASYAVGLKPTTVCQPQDSVYIIPSSHWMPADLVHTH